MPWTRDGDAVNPRSLGVEAAWIPVEMDQVAALLNVLIPLLGFPKASGLVTWLQMKAMGERDATSKKTRSDYRQILVKLEKEGIRPPEPTGGVRLRRGVEALAATGVEGIGAKADELVRSQALAAEGGFAAGGLPLLVVVAAAAAAGVARGGSLAAGFALAVPDITSHRGDHRPSLSGEDEGAGHGLAPVVPMRRRVRIDDMVDARHDAHREAA